MLERFYPNLYVDSLLSIPLDIFPQNHIKGIILDLDNTVTKWNSNVIQPPVKQWFDNLQTMSLPVCLLSNNGEERVVKVARQLAIPYVHRARKPSRVGYYRAFQLLNSNQENTAVIGDQIFTDVWGGNRLGLFTILVKPIEGPEFPGTKISRFFERRLLNRMMKSEKVHNRI